MVINKNGHMIKDSQNHVWQYNNQDEEFFDIIRNVIKSHLKVDILRNIQHKNRIGYRLIR